MKLICVDKVREGYLNKGIEHYIERINHHKYFDVHRVKKSNPKKEGIDILDKLKEGSYVVVLSEEGKEFTSIEFSDFIKNNNRDITYIIGGTDGLSDKVKERADLVMSLSKMTFTHEMAQLFFLEQIYRHQMIKSGRSYHR